METQSVIVPVADMRKAPDHRSERVSQILYGHSIELLDEQERFFKVQSEDQYQGWVGKSYLSDEVHRCIDKHYAASPITLFILRNQQRQLLLPLGSFVDLVDKEKGIFRLHNDNASLKVGETISAKTQISDPITIASQFLGSPYLWGGVSPFGVDCSGLVQSVYRLCGKLLPRDSADQAKEGEEIEREQVRQGDLFFWKGHVAISLGEQRILHASRRRGYVAIESLDKSDSDFRADLTDCITSVRRVFN